MNVGKSKRKNKKNLAPLVLESSFMAKGSVMSCKEKVVSFGWLDNSSKSDLTVQHVFVWGCLNEGGGDRGLVWGGGVDRAFPEESLQSVSLRHI